MFVINCTKDLPMIIDDGIRLYVNDDMEENSFEIMYKALPYFIEMIDIKRKEGKDVVVHCLAGRQRSACIICAYLMIKLKYSYEEAIGGINFDICLRKIVEVLKPKNHILGFNR